MRKLAVVAVVLLGCGAPSPLHGSAEPTPFVLSPPSPAAGLQHYVDAANNWSIDYPDGWRVDPANPAFVQFHDPEDGALVGVHVKPTDQPLNIVVDNSLAFEEQYHRQSDLTMTVSSRQQIALPDGTPAVDLVVEIVPGGRSHQLFVVKAGKAYSVNAETYVATWDKFSADFDRMLGSFRPPA